MSRLKMEVKTERIRMLFLLRWVHQTATQINTCVPLHCQEKIGMCPSLRTKMWSEWDSNPVLRQQVMILGWHKFMYFYDFSTALKEPLLHT
jgi:hypothetical protein